jgi:hypothetical protein
MNQQEKIELFGPIYALCPDKFKFTVDDKIVLCFLQKVSKELVDSFKFVT